MNFATYKGQYVGCNPVEVGRSAERRIRELENALRAISRHNDSPARFDAYVQSVIDGVIDTSDTVFGKG